MADITNVRNSTKRRREKQIKHIRNRKKAHMVFIIAVFFLLILVARIGVIQFVDGEDYSKEVLDHQSYTSTTIPYKRGEILDRNGAILAYSERVFNLILDPKVLLSDDKYREPTLQALSRCFDIDRGEVELILVNKPKSQYEKLKTKLTSDETKEFRQLMESDENIKGVWFEDSYIRNYPFSTMACHVVGFATANNGGESGIELYYDDELTGTDGITYSYIDDNLDVQSTNKAAVDGCNIVSTIDYNIQKIVEEEIINYNNQFPSAATAAIVMDPSNSEIYAMASYPFYNLNTPRDIENAIGVGEVDIDSDEEVSKALNTIWRNYCISETLEPGSTFKAFTVAACLEEGVAHDGDSFYCDGFEEIGGYTIKCASYYDGGHKSLDLRGGLMYSCNDVMMNISSKLGGVKFAQYQRRFGFGAKTGIDLPAEESGIIKSGALSSTDIATNSFGQNINVTMIQMAASFSSVINGGNYYQPHVVKRIEKASGEVVKNYEPTLVSQTVTSSTSLLMRKYLESVVSKGTANSAAIDGYAVGGKTATAQKGKRSDKKWIVSFIGFAPANDPKVLVYVLIDEPFGSEGTDDIDSTDARIIEKNIMERILPYLNIFKDPKVEAAELEIKEGSATLDIENTDETTNIDRSNTNSVSNSSNNSNITATTSPVANDQNVTGSQATTGSQSPNQGMNTETTAGATETTKPQESQTTSIQETSGRAEQTQSTTAVQTQGIDQQSSG